MPLGFVPAPNGRSRHWLQLTAGRADSYGGNVGGAIVCHIRQTCPWIGLLSLRDSCRSNGDPATGVSLPVVALTV